MSIYSIARKANSYVKAARKKMAGQHLSPVRRIEFVSPPKDGRYVAMTFDDGPCAAPTNPKGGRGDRGLTETILDILGEYGGTATFDVVGDTGENYPDSEGTPGDFTWSGVHYDHYPCYGKDSLAGAVNQRELVSRIMAEGHEVSNHGYTHRLFGPMRAVYGKRRHFENLGQVTGDLRRLHEYMKSEFSYEMKLARPPHYIDKIPEGGTAYDAYRILGYNYMAASFDGAGWLPMPTYEEEVDKMVAPMKAALDADENSLNGRIIFQKDGCNMKLRTPVADDLAPQLELLRDAGYKVVPVSVLLDMSPFEDLPGDSFAYPYVKTMLRSGFTVGYRNNTFQGKREVTPDELMIMTCPPQYLREERPMSYGDFVKTASEHSLWGEAGAPAGRLLGNIMLDKAMALGLDVEERFFKDKRSVLREHAVQIAAGIIENRQKQADKQ